MPRLHYTNLALIIKFPTHLTVLPDKSRKSEASRGWLGTRKSAPERCMCLTVSRFETKGSPMCLARYISGVSRQLFGGATASESARHATSENMGDLG